MTSLAKWLIAALLATYFDTSVHAQNSCLADGRCSAAALAINEGELDLNNCGMIDSDLADLATCFDDTGRSSISTLTLYDNLFTAIPSNLFEGMAALERLDLYDNELTTLPSGVFAGLGTLTRLNLDYNQLATLPSDVFAGLEALTVLNLYANQLTALPSGIFAGLEALTDLNLYENQMATLPSDIFAGLEALTDLDMTDMQLTTLPSGIFAGLVALDDLSLSENKLTTLPSGAFAGLEALSRLYIYENQLTSLPSGVFAGLEALTGLDISDNALTTLPAGLFEELSSEDVGLDDNPDLQCFPSFSGSGVSTDSGQDITTTGCCECTDVATCDAGFVCNPGENGYTCDACEDDSECDTGAGEKCCEACNVCETSADIDAGACGDPHMTGFRGQKFDFTGKDGAWYAVVSDLPYMHVNMRVTSPVPSVPEITYITGISIVTTDAGGLEHTILISVKNPHSMESSCAAGVPSCLADGALHVIVDGEEVMISPGEVSIAPGVAIGAVNLPGACRSFGFEKYWERKVERLSQAGRRLSLDMGMQDMSDWVLADPTATNMVECAEYVAEATAVDGVGLFAHHSEHASFQIRTPTATIRLSHGRLHQLPMRDPTDQFDLPDHLTWQMNLAVDHADMSLDATGILGETLVPTRDEHGAPIMQGMGAIRGAQEDYRVSGPLGIVFSQGQHHE